MKKIGFCLIFVFLLAFAFTGCNQTPEQPPNDPPADESVEIPTMQELVEINDPKNVLKDHDNVFVNIVWKSSNPILNYTEDVIYFKNDAGLCYHKREVHENDGYWGYTSLVGNAFYSVAESGSMAILTEGDDVYFDHTLDFESTPVGKAYIENGRIVYHTYYIFEADEMFDASRDDYTLYFNKDTKLLERIDCVSYNTDHQIEYEYSSAVSYDVANAEDTFETTAYEIVMASDKKINLEIIANYGTPEQTSYSFVSMTDSMVLASFNDLTYLLYTDPEYQNEVETLDAYEGQKNLTLYAKKYEAPQTPPPASDEIPTFEELLEINTLENIFKDHSNACVYVDSKSDEEAFGFTEETVYIKDETGFCYHERTAYSADGSYYYVSAVGNVFYHFHDGMLASIMIDSANPYSDPTWDFASTPIGKGYIEDEWIVYHTFYIFEADEVFEALRYDITMYFNRDTKLIEKVYYATYNSEHQVESETTLTMAYDIENVEDKLDITAYDAIINSENKIDLEIIADFGTPEQKTYRFVTSADSSLYVEIGGEKYLLYSDEAFQNEVETLDAYKGQKNLTLYAKKTEA